MLKSHKMFRWLGRLLVGISAILLLLAGGCVIWLWGWTLKDDPKFHESWTPQEQAALTDFDRYLRHQYAADAFTAMEDWQLMFKDSGMPIRTLGWREKLMAAYTAKMVAAPISDMLHEAAETGSAAQSGSVSFMDTYGFTPAIVAAQTAHLKALEALVRHGANPNSIADVRQAGCEVMEVDTPLSPLLNGQFTNGRHLPWEERRATAEVLLKHGADINCTQILHGRSCDMALMMRNPEGDAPWQWALDNGLIMQHRNLVSIVLTPSTRALVERALRDKLVDINAVDGNGTVLQYLSRRLLFNHAEGLTDAEWELYLDMLLAAGADPNLIPLNAGPQRPGESDEEYEVRLASGDLIHESPLTIVNAALEKATTPARRELCLRALEKLRAAGARPTAPAAGQE